MRSAPLNDSLPALQGGVGEPVQFVYDTCVMSSCIVVSRYNKDGDSLIILV